MLFKLFAPCNFGSSENPSNALLTIVSEHIEDKRIFGFNRLPIKNCTLACKPVDKALKGGMTKSRELLEDY